MASSSTENDPDTVGFLARVSMLPLAKTVLQVYERMKASSKIIKVWFSPSSLSRLHRRILTDLTLAFSMSLKPWDRP